jgi:hypothetical protein
MNLEEELLREHSKRQATRIATWIGADKRRFKVLMEYFLKGEYRLAQRAAWVVSICAEGHPLLVRPYLKQMIARMQESGIHDAVKRSVTWILQTAEIPKGLLGTVATICFEHLSDPKTPIAVKAHSMTILARIAQKEPDLGRELRLIVEQQLPYASGALHARYRQVMKMLEPAVSQAKEQR